jgi:restriction system protein
MPDLTFTHAAEQLLRERGPMHYRGLTTAILEAGLAQTSASDPPASLNAALSVEIKTNGQGSVFIRIGPGMFGLRGIHEAALPALPEPSSTSSDSRRLSSNCGAHRRTPSIGPTHRPGSRID